MGSYAGWNRHESPFAAAAHIVKSANRAPSPPSTIVTCGKEERTALSMYAYKTGLEVAFGSATHRTTLWKGVHLSGRLDGMHADRCAHRYARKQIRKCKTRVDSLVQVRNFRGENAPEPISQKRLPARARADACVHALNGYTRRRSNPNVQRRHGNRCRPMG